MRGLFCLCAKGEELEDFQLLGEDPDYEKGKLSYFDDEDRRRYVPYVIEPAAGADRATLAFLCDAYDVIKVDDKGQPEEEVLRLHPRLAPIKMAALPLVNKDGMPERARAIRRAAQAPRDDVRRRRVDRLTYRR
jgi:glycyl-tRNA synthetase